MITVSFKLFIASYYYLDINKGATLPNSLIAKSRQEMFNELRTRFLQARKEGFILAVLRMDEKVRFINLENVKEK